MRAVRPGDLYFLLVPGPTGIASFFAQHQWISAALVVTGLMVVGVFVRLGHVVVKEVQEKGLFPWKEERQAFLDSRVLHEQRRQMAKLEGEQQRREFKRRSSSSWWDQLRLFR